MRGAAHVGRQSMTLLIGGKGVLEDRLQRDERHRGLRTRGRRLSLSGLLQYHANYPRCKRLVQDAICKLARHSWRRALQRPEPAQERKTAKASGCVIVEER